MLRNRPGGAVLRLATDGDLEGDWASSIHPAAAGTIFASSHGYLGRGANLLDLRFLVVDANLYHYAAGFNTATITPEEFARLRAEDRLVTLRQNLGRALRGEPGKHVVVFVLDADADLVAYLRTLPALVAGSERPPLVVWRDDLGPAVAEAKIWLTNKGGDWPALAGPRDPPEGPRPPPVRPRSEGRNPGQNLGRGPPGKPGREDVARVRSPAPPRPRRIVPSRRTGRT